MRLSHLQHQVRDLVEEKGLNWEDPGFHQQIVLLHSNISGIAMAYQERQRSQELFRQTAELLIRVAYFPALHPDWGDIWGSQTLDDFQPHKEDKDIWDTLYTMHQLVSGLVGGRSDIILLYKLVQVIRSSASLLEVDLPRAVKSRMDAYWDTDKNLN